jgi:3-hydroxyacyl-[acyl-carrier-protein] dehydratase
MQFYQPVYPGEKVRVRSQIHYFRFNKLRCGVRMFNQNEQLVCRGILAGMLIPRTHE